MSLKDILQDKINHKYFKNSFFAVTIKEWNMHDFRYNINQIISLIALTLKE